MKKILVEKAEVSFLTVDISHDYISFHHDVFFQMSGNNGGNNVGNQLSLFDGQQNVSSGGGPQQLNGNQRNAVNSVMHGLQLVAEAFAPPPPITSVWRIELGNSYGSSVQHETYNLFKGSFGPYENLVVKEAQKNGAGVNELAENEFKVLAKVRKCEHFQQLVHVGESPTSFFIALENCGKNLTHVLGIQYRISPKQLPSLYRQLLEGFFFLHNTGILHRDIDFGNLFFHARKNPSFKIGGLKHAVLDDGNDFQNRRKADIPLGRLKWRYHGYGANNYSIREENFLIGCVMNSVSNFQVLADNTMVERASVLIDGDSYHERSAINLNQVLMSADAGAGSFGFPATQHHYLMWTSSKNYQFIITCYDYLEGLRARCVTGSQASQDECQRALQRLKDSLEDDHGHLYENTWQFGWLHCVSNRFLKTLLRGKVTNFSVFSLLATIRSRGAHHFEDIDEIQHFFRALPEEYIQAWLVMFPGLISHMVRWVIKNNLHNEVLSFGNFFPGDSAFWDLVSDMPFDIFKTRRAWY